MNQIPAATPTMTLEPDLWARQAQKLAAEYNGLPEAPLFLQFARQFMALAAALKEKNATGAD